MSGFVPCQYCGNYYCGVEHDIQTERCEGYYMSLRDKTMKFEKLPENLAYDSGKYATKHEVEAYLTAYLGDDFFARRFADCMELIRAKNADYSQGEQKGDRIAAFRRIGRDIDVSMQKVWAILAQKHWGAIMKYVKDGILESEPIEGRINDLINYFVLLSAIVEDERERQLQSEEL